MTNFVKRIISHLPYELIVILVIVGLAITGVTVASKRISKNLTNNVAQALSSPSPVENPSLSPTASHSPSPKMDVLGVETKAPKPVTTSETTEISKTDSSTRIELCKAQAENEKIKYKNEEYAKADQGALALAKAATDAEIQQIGLKYGYFKESDVVDGVALYNQFRQDGFSISQAEGMANNAITAWRTYLHNLRDSAKKHVTDFESRLESNAAIYENNYYMQCLNGS